MARIGVIVLAAGRSTRFAPGTTSKLLALVDDVPVVRRSVAAAAVADIGEIVVVTGHMAAEVRDALVGMPVRVVHEPEFGSGMAASLVRGVRSLADADAVMIALADQPGMRPEAYRRVAERWTIAGAPIVVPRYAASPGPSHPTLFSASLFDELLALRGDVGARSVITRHAAHVVEVMLEWSAPEDVDTIDDLRAVTARGRSIEVSDSHRTHSSDESR